MIEQRIKKIMHYKNNTLIPQMTMTTHKYNNDVIFKCTSQS